MPDYLAKKIPIETGINDLPIAPTSTQGLNISYLCAKFNDLVTNLEADLQDTGGVDQNTLDNLLQLESIVNNLTDTTNDLYSDLGLLQNSVEDNSNDLLIVSSQLLTPSSSFSNNLTIFIDLDTGNDTNDGLSASTPIATLDRLTLLLREKKIPENLSLNIRGTVTGTIDLTKITFQYIGTTDFFIPTITLTTDSQTNWSFSGSGLMILIDTPFPLNFVIEKCDLFASVESLKLAGITGEVEFRSCSFDCLGGNTSEILYCEKTKIILTDVVNGIIFNNSNSASLSSAIRLNNSQAEIEGTSVNDIPVFCVLENESKVTNKNNTIATTNVTTHFSITKNSLLISNRASTFSPPTILIDGTSSINHSYVLPFVFTNPPLNQSMKLFEDRVKDHRIYLKGSSTNITGLTFDVLSDGTDLDSVFNFVEKDKNLTIVFTGSTPIDYATILFEVHDFV